MNQLVPVRGQRVGVVVSGGNLDLALLGETVASEPGSPAVQ
jgi:threonine dehydratase